MYGKCFYSPPHPAAALLFKYREIFRGFGPAKGIGYITYGILHLTSHPDPIDEWTQINIINALKKRDIEDTQGIELLLESKNSTVIRLGLKIISTLHLSNKAGFISELIENAPSNAIKFEAQAVMEAFTTNTR